MRADTAINPAGIGRIAPIRSQKGMLETEFIYRLNERNQLCIVKKKQCLKKCENWI